MKVKICIISFFALLMSNICLNAQNKNYADSWKKVQTFEEKSLPASALTETEKIYNLAVRDNNYPQIIKALIHRLKFQSATDNNINSLIADLKQRLTETKNVSERAILNSMLAEAYQQYYNSRAYTINQRTPSPESENIEEWSKNIFTDKILKHINASLTPAENLQKTLATNYKDVLNTGDDSRTLRPALFDFLAYRALDLTKNTTDISDSLTVDIYKQLIKFHEEDKQKDALIYATLQLLEFEKNISLKDEDDFLEELINLKKKYAADLACVEILALEANFYLLQASESDDELEQNRKKAYDICKNGIVRYGAYRRINLLKNIQAEIEQPLLNVQAKELIYPKTPISFTIKYTNLKNVTLNIYKIDKSAMSYFNQRAENQKKKEGTLILTHNIDLPQKYKYTRQVYEYTFPANLENGIYEYEIIIKGSENNTRQSLFVTPYALIERCRGEIGEFYVLDRQSGLPQKNAFLTIYESKYENRRQKYIFLKSIACDENGYATYNIDKQQNIYIGISSLTEDIYSLHNKYLYKYDRKNEITEQKIVNLFTDRAIYRPGQTVYFKGIAYNQSTKDLNVIEHKTYNVKLFDANYREISSIDVKTNEFGSFTGNFVLPSGGLSGNFTIMCENSESQTFRVEEYKRPSIEITFETQKGAYSFGDTLALCGKAYNYTDYPVRNAKAKYRIVQRPRYLYRMYQEKEVANGEVSTDNKGCFSINFVPKTKNKTLEIDYILYVEITDAKGETQKNEFYLTVKDKSMELTSNIGNYIKKEDTASIKLSAKNFQNEALTPIISYQIFKILPRKTLRDTTTVLEKTTAIVGIVDLSKSNVLSKMRINALPSGRYRIIFSAVDHRGRKNILQQDFMLYSETDKKLPDKEYIFVDKIKTECAVGENAEILFGTSANVKVLYQVLSGNTVFENQWLTFNDEMHLFRIPFKEIYGEQATVEIIFVKDEEIFNENIILRKKNNQELNVKISSFRDKLLPGQQEEWTIKVSDYKGKGTNAELLATLYDASLDAFGKQIWHFQPQTIRFVSPQWDSQIGKENYSYTYFPNNFKNVKDYNFDSFNWFGMNFYGYNKMLRTAGGGIRVEGTAAPAEDKMMSVNVESANMVMADEGAFEGMTLDCVAATTFTAQNEKSAAQIQIRKNFAETAFFYPQLKTNKKGETLISFKIPESLTRWNFMGLAHTKDLKYGQIATSIITQKTFMISGNMPRFVRIDDKIVLTAEIANLDNNAKSGKATLEILNPENETVISTQTVKFKVDADNVTTVAWNYHIDNQYDLLIFRLTAQSDKFSDGEQYLIPVLPNKMLVTESLPLNIHGKETKHFTFEKMKNASANAENKYFTIEFSSNPTWYAVQALPYLSVTTDENVLSLFSAYYANTLASHIVNSNPKITKVFEQWKADKNTLISKLQENQELKNILLAETPYVADAKNETEQMQRIALLFDLNNLTTATTQMLNQLTELQLPNGAFPWFKGMREDRFVTQFVLDGISKLDKIYVIVSDSKKNQEKAINFIDFCIKDDLEQLKKNNKNYKTEKSLSAEQIYYHYVRSAYKNIVVPKDTKEAFDFYFAQMKKQWTERSLYEQALIATTMYRNNEKTLALDIIKSLREHSKISDELGMYWENNTSGYFWHESAIRTQTALIEAFSEIINDQSEIDNLKIWLLKQKQTQIWDSNISTVNAIYALLLNGNNWLASNENATISVGNDILTEKSGIGTGYIKKTYEKSKITPNLANISISNHTDGIAWGAAYWQYFEKFDKIEKQTNNLNIDKKLFIERTGNKGKYLEPLTENTILKAGDKITVRLTVRTDRDMEYVCLKDLHASCFEPVEQLSGYRFRQEVGYYQSTKDASVQFFFNYLPKGTYVFEYGLWTSRAGEYNNGIASLQSLYAPEFVSHTESRKIKVDK